MPLTPAAPDFPAWANAFAAQLKRLRAALGPTLGQFQTLFAAWIPAWRLARQDDGLHSRDRHWNLRLTFWTFLWQVAHLLWLLLCHSCLRRLYGWARRATAHGLAHALWEGLRACRLPPDLPPLGQLRFGFG